MTKQQREEKKILRDQSTLTITYHVEGEDLRINLDMSEDVKDPMIVIEILSRTLGTVIHNCFEQQLVKSGSKALIISHCLQFIEDSAKMPKIEIPHMQPIIISQ